MKMKGELDEAVKLLGFEYTSIWRPGLLEREEKSRCVEGCAKCLCFRTMHCRTLASAIVRDLIHVRANFVEGNDKQHHDVNVFGNEEIYAKSDIKSRPQNCCCIIM